jgi:hypothetical protein
MRLWLGMTAVALAAAMVAACGNLGVGHPSHSSSSAAAAPADPVPKVEIRSPARGSFLAPGPVAIMGVVTPANAPIQSVTLLGQPVAVSANGEFRGLSTLNEGLNTIQATATDTSGKVGDTTIGVLAGTYSDISKPVPAAAGVRFTAPALDAIGKILEGVIWSEDFTTILGGLGNFQATSILFVSLDATVTQVRFQGVHCTIVPTAQGLMAQADVNGIILDVDATVDYGFGPGSPTPVGLQADDATVTGLVVFTPQPDGSIVTTISNAQITFQNFRVAAAGGGIIAAVLPYLQTIVENAVTNKLVSLLENTAPPALDRALKNALLGPPPTVLGTPFGPNILFERIDYDTQGITAQAAFQASTGPFTALGQAAPGSLSTAGGLPSLATTRGFRASVDDDGINRAAYMAWAGGVFNITMDAQFFQSVNANLPFTLNVGMVKTFIPEIAGLIPDTAPIAFRLEPGLPPICEVAGSPDIAIVHAGEVGFDVLVDRGQGWERLVKMVAQIDVGLGLGLSTQGLSITSAGSPHVQSDVVDDPIVTLNDRHLEVLIDLVFTALPQLLNSVQQIPIPQFNQLQSLNVSLYADGPALEHIGAEGDIIR